MSVDKKYRIAKNNSNFSIIPNYVAQKLNYNLEALGLYVYIFSLPPEWEFYKSHLRKVCNLGINKLNKLLCILEEHNLVQTVQIRDKKGKFCHFEMTVHSGEHFKDINKNNELDESVQPYHGFCRAVKTVTPVTAPIKNINTKKDSFKDNKEDIYCASDDARDKSFEEFWKAYPVKKNKVRAKKIWEKIKHETIVLIMADIAIRKEKDYQWKNAQYIPHPTTYLNGERWNDELILHIETKPKLEFKKLNEEIKSTVKDWAPGNPDYDRVHSFDRH